MENHEAELPACLLVEVKDVFLSTVCVCFQHHHVEVVEQSHYQPLVELHVFPQIL